MCGRTSVSVLTVSTGHSVTTVQSSDQRFQPSSGYLQLSEKVKIYQVMPLSHSSCLQPALQEWWSVHEEQCVLLCTGIHRAAV